MITTLKKDEEQTEEAVKSEKVEEKKGEVEIEQPT